MLKSLKNVAMENVMKKPIRVLHVFGRTDRGGAETFIMNIYRQIDRTQIQFDFMVHTEDECAYDKEILNLGGRIFRVPRYNGKNHFEYKKAWKAFFEKHPECTIIHGHMTSTAAIYLKIAKKFDKKTISHIHSTAPVGKGISATAKQLFERNAKKYADHLFACSKAAAAWCYGEKYTEHNDVKVIKNAIDVNRFVFDENTRAAKRAELGLTNNFVIGHVGNFVIPKNHSFLIDVFYEVSKKNNDAVLLLVGGGSLRKEIEDKVAKLGLVDRVIFAGVRSDIPELLCAMDVFVFPSLWEGFAVALVEAQASGLLCIVSDTIPNEVDISELVKFVSLSENALDWAHNVVSLALENTKRQLFSIKIAKAGFDATTTAGLLEKFYLGE